MGCGASKAGGGGGSSTPAARLEAAGKRGLEPLLAYLRSGGEGSGSKLPSEAELRALADDASAARWLQAVHASVDAVWSPLIAELEKRIASANGGSASWDTVTTVDLLKFVLEATGGNPADVCEATTALLGVAHGLWERQRERSLRGHNK